MEAPNRVGSYPKRELVALIIGEVILTRHATLKSADYGQVEIAGKLRLIRRYSPTFWKLAEEGKPREGR